MEAHPHPGPDPLPQLVRHPQLVVGDLGHLGAGLHVGLQGVQWIQTLLQDLLGGGMPYQLAGPVQQHAVRLPRLLQKGYLSGLRLEFGVATEAEGRGRSCSGHSMSVKLTTEL